MGLDRNVRGSLRSAFGEVIWVARVRRELTQRELGSYGGLHASSIGRIERGELNPTLEAIARLSHGLQLRPSTLIALAERGQGLDAGAQEAVCPVLASERGGMTEEDLRAASYRARPSSRKAAK